ncbi:MAG: single-stranded DNA-binding protein [Kiritimatiellia bacterium]|nr:single-stranded DNA-binding protein [Lentisphaerota bacterium]
MAAINRVLLYGNLTCDPVLRYLPGGQAVADFQLAVNRDYRAADGADANETCFVGVVVWGGQAETAAAGLQKGAPVLVEGSLVYEQWESAQGRRNRLRVKAARLQWQRAEGNTAKRRFRPLPDEDMENLPV